MAEKARIEQAGKLHWFHWFIVFASLILTITAWYIARSQHTQQVISQYQRETAQTLQLISERMRKYEDTLSSAAAFLETRDEALDAQTWKAYSDALNIDVKYPGINGIGVIYNVSQDSRNIFLEQQRKTRPDFKIHPRHTQDEFLPITFIEPLSTNAAALGLDIAHESNRYVAAKKAHDDGKPHITGPIVLVQDAQKTPGFLFYVPIRSALEKSETETQQETFSGLVYAPFIFEKLMKGTLETDRRHIGIKITDQGTVLYDENHAGIDDFDPNPLFKTTATVNMYGRNWSFDIWSKASFRQANISSKPWIILLGGIFIDIMLLTVFVLFARANQRAAKFATDLAQSHQDTATRLTDRFENAVDGLFTLDKHGDIQSYNKACQDIFGYTAREAAGKNFNLLIPEISLTEPETMGATTEVTARHSNGLFFPVEVSINSLSIRGHEVFSGTVRDITPRKEAEMVIQTAMHDLKQSNDDLEKFAYIASHDLKSPLRAIDNLSAWIEEDIGKNLDAVNADRLKKMRGRVSRMERLLDDLLHYSRATHKEHPPEPITAKNLVRDISKTLNIPNSFTLNIDETLNDIIVSRMPVKQVFHNLINNAVKHHDKENGQIIISGRDLGAYFEFTVADDGPGIHPNYHNKIFEMFQTLRRRDEVEASGMGLTIIKKIVQRSGGQIHVKSTPGHGCSFIFTWPKIDFSETQAA